METARRVSVLGFTPLSCEHLLYWTKVGPCDQQNSVEEMG